MSGALKELERDWLDAERRKRDVEERMYLRKGELEAALRRALDAEFGKELAAVSADAAKASKALKEAVAAKRTEDNLRSMPHPEGTVLHRWKRAAYSWGAPFRETGESAVVQIFREGDPVKTNMRLKPEVGSVVLRDLNKDGAPGRAVLCWEPYMAGFWLPKGQEPRQKG